MKIMMQIAIIFLLCLIGEVIAAILPFPFPASVISMILVFCFLLWGPLKVYHIRKQTDFLLDNMAFFFIPAGVNVINYLDILRANWLPLLLICVLTTIITFAATTYSVRFTMYLLSRRKGGCHA